MIKLIIGKQCTGKTELLKKYAQQHINDVFVVHTNNYFDEYPHVCNDDKLLVSRDIVSDINYMNSVVQKIEQNLHKNIIFESIYAVLPIYNTNRLYLLKPLLHSLYNSEKEVIFTVHRLDTIPKIVLEMYAEKLEILFTFSNSQFTKKHLTEHQHIIQKCIDNGIKVSFYHMGNTTVIQHTQELLEYCNTLSEFNQKLIS